MAIVKGFPPTEENPLQFQELKLIFQAYEPTWPDVQQLLRVLLPEEKLRKLIAASKWPAEPKDFNLNDEEALEKHKEERERLVRGILVAFPKKPDWTKINSCRQQEGENPSAYLDHLTRTFSQHLGIKDPLENATQALGAAFVQGLLPADSTQGHYSGLGNGKVR